MKYKIGITLAGGGARGSYAAGVLRYLYSELPKKLGYIPWPYIVSGTSVGALNGYFAASHSMYEIRRMTDIWTNITLQDIYTIPKGGTISSIRTIWTSLQKSYLLKPKPLERMIQREAERRTLRHSIEGNQCKAFFVSATCLRNGENVVFMDCVDPEYTISPPPKGKVIRTRLYPHHLMASSAIPMLFPPVQIDGEYYIDGGVRQNAPLHPLLYGGAEKIFVISTRAENTVQSNDSLNPTLALVAGKTLNALTLDPIERDGQRARQINEIIDWGVKKYGNSFAEDINKSLGLKSVHMLQFQPSKDLGKLAVQSVNIPQMKTEGNLGWILEKLITNAHNKESDFLSQLLFDQSYTKLAEELGFTDTQRREEEIIAFLSK